MLLRITPTPVIDFCLNDPNKRENSLSKMLQSYQKMTELDIKKGIPWSLRTFWTTSKINQKFKLAELKSGKKKPLILIQNGKHRFFELFDALYANRMNFPGMSMLRGYLDLLLEEQRIEAERRK